MRLRRIVVGLALSCSAASAAERPFTLDATGANSTRAAGTLARDGFEENLRLGWSASESWTLEAGVGRWQGDELQGHSFSAEGRYTLRSDESPAAYSFGAGYRRDFDGADVPYLRLGASTTLQSWDLAAATQIEKPLAADRDSTDFIVNFGASRLVMPDLRAGFEVAGEDLEGLFEDDEAEGGAKLLLGPVMQLPHSVGRLRLGVAWVHALSVSTSPAGVVRNSGDGVALRVGMSF